MGWLSPLLTKYPQLRELAADLPNGMRRVQELSLAGQTELIFAMESSSKSSA